MTPKNEAMMMMVAMRTLMTMTLMTTAKITDHEHGSAGLEDMGTVTNHTELIQGRHPLLHIPVQLMRHRHQQVITCAAYY